MTTSCENHFVSRIFLVTLHHKAHPQVLQTIIATLADVLYCTLLCKDNKMYSLNLPSYAIKVGGTKARPTVFDPLRGKYVALTPEEWVRQHFVHFLVHHKSYPQLLMANEVALNIGDKSLRADSVLYDRELKPRMIIEYKAPTITLTQKVFDQITVYNMLLHVDYLVVSNGLQHICCKMNYEDNSYTFLSHIPHYTEI